MAKKKSSRKIKTKTKREKTDDEQTDALDNASGWASIPGEKLKVDIADGAGSSSNKSKKRPRSVIGSSSVGVNSSGKKRGRSEEEDEEDAYYDDRGEDQDEFDEDEDYFLTEKWTSRHYDDDETDTNRIERDLFDPDPNAKSNKFDANSKFDGANDAGMFFSLEVIPGDAYRVETSGTEDTGFVNKVVFVKDKSGDGDGRSKHEAEKSSKSKGGGSTKPDKHGGKGEQPEGNASSKQLSKQEKLKAKQKAKREKAKEAKGQKNLSGEKSSSESAALEEQTQEQMKQIQTTWSIAAPGVSLHSILCRGLSNLNYSYPTPIQSATLPAAILGRRDVVGAAPTGSGKTLSYGLPILQRLLEENCSQNDDGPKELNQNSSNPNKLPPMPLQALILCPTRELAMQVTEELRKVCCQSVQVGTIVGGFAEVKQKRVLEKVRPPILVATPGRLWELMSNHEYSHLNNLSQLRFLVIDEADRMIKQGSFPQLQQIFEVINDANPAPEDPESLEDDLDDADDDDRLKSLQGVKGEAKVVMLDDAILAAIEKQRNLGSGGKGKGVPKPVEVDDDEYEQQLLMNEDSQSDSEDSDEPVHRQTFVYSATLTLPPSTHHLIKQDSSSNKSSRKKAKREATTVDGAIAEMLDIAGARGTTKIVDLSNALPEGTKQQSKKKLKTEMSNEDDKNTNKPVAAPLTSSAARLPPGLELGEIRCAQRHKDSHLYAYLITTQQGSSGPCLVFCNSIAAVRRVGDTLKTLGLPAKMLHAQMAQKSRLSSLESLRSPKSRAIVVASDVAARGLDIPSVATVIHYDVARTVDTFIHRSGRTARGVGEKAVGTSISLVAPAEEREHQKICTAVQGFEAKSLAPVHLDGRLLSAAQERVALATKIMTCNDIESQANKKNKWLKDTAEEAGLEVDEDMMESGLLEGDRREQQQLIEAKRAKAELRQLLATPIRKQHFGKFLSGVGLLDAIKTEKEVKPYIVKEPNPRRKKKKKKQGK